MTVLSCICLWESITGTICFYRILLWCQYVISSVKLSKVILTDWIQIRTPKNWFQIQPWAFEHWLLSVYNKLSWDHELTYIHSSFSYLFFSLIIQIGNCLERCKICSNIGVPSRGVWGYTTFWKPWFQIEICGGIIFLSSLQMLGWFWSLKTQWPAWFGWITKCWVKIHVYEETKLWSWGW